MNDNKKTTTTREEQIINLAKEYMQAVQDWKAQGNERAAAELTRRAVATLQRLHTECRDSELDAVRDAVRWVQAKRRW